MATKPWGTPGTRGNCGALGVCGADDSVQPPVWHGSKWEQPNGPLGNTSWLPPNVAPSTLKCCADAVGRRVASLLQLQGGQLPHAACLMPPAASCMQIGCDNSAYLQLQPSIGSLASASLHLMAFPFDVVV
ncbi:hypothetical protein ACLKA6_004879 [Drosophila palustris]